MIVGIDASNLRAGGGVTHLLGVLGNADPEQQGVTRIVVWCGTKIAARLPVRSWLVPIVEEVLDQRGPACLFWQSIVLPGLARRRCDLLFAPGGLALGGFRPIVTMSRNMLPFDPIERARFNNSIAGVRLRLLRWGQAFSYRRSDGVIFLTEYARREISAAARLASSNVAVVPHGVDDRFRRMPRRSRGVSSCSLQQPLRVLYVSTVNRYKHQWNVVRAISQLREEGIPVELELVGPAERASLERLQASIRAIDPQHEFIHYTGPAAFNELPAKYEQADIFVFASSCENMPNILLEAMASGLPVASSSRGPMPEVLGPAGKYFDPEQPEEIARSVRELIVDHHLRDRLAQMAYERSAKFAWSTCARSTLTFLRSTHERYRRSTGATG